MSGTDLAIAAAIFARSIVSFDACLSQASQFPGPPASAQWQRPHTPEFVVRRGRRGLSQDPERRRAQVKPVARPLFVVMPPSVGSRRQ
jgi:hypothetical protein